MFRDHLRGNDADRELYERTKRELAGRRWKYVQHYANAKSEVVAEIMTRAVRPRYGRLVVLNGVSSAGKTTLACAFRDARAAVGEFWFLVGIDDVLSKLPAQWVDLGLEAGEGSHANDGMRFEAGPSGVTLRVGSVGRKLLEVYHRTVAAAVRLGLNVIVNDVVVDDATRDDWFHVLDGLDPTWVAIQCLPEVADRRNAIEATGLSAWRACSRTWCIEASRTPSKSTRVP
jgi:chloramphenicol 3-O-phosphotransferase